MANSSGRIQSLQPAEYLHQPSSTRYTISSKATVTIETPAAKARQQLDFFIGSGTHGQSFLFLRNRKLFEAPITIYTHKGWGPSPGYENDKNSDPSPATASGATQAGRSPSTALPTLTPNPSSPTVASPASAATPKTRSTSTTLPSSPPRPATMSAASAISSTVAPISLANPSSATSPGSFSTTSSAMKPSPNNQTPR
jgi:hypothetical protein